MNYHWNGYLKKTIGLVCKGGAISRQEIRERPGLPTGVKK
jgi:hypothetical protein